jgi:hypothetical protein
VVGRHGVELVTALQIREHRHRLKGGRRSVGRRQLSTFPHELINELCESETPSWVGLHDDDATQAQPRADHPPARGRRETVRRRGDQSTP